ncbi:hypothetical protein [Morganella psychrotolerans]|uniref:Uncharacterized protein n=1 Tax=Morganella psychrotolerans TaxID=368603 RepID=A0A1B8HFC1_9GAMM|nr:hypothetical protein [Morganella psychrotolerans]OBU07776.1 hypothetical protein AYY18_06025 [Morganella psychrotolerans]
MEYEFEKYTGVTIVPEDMVYATPVLFAILASLVAGDSEEKQDKLYKLIDKAIEMNKETSSAAQLAVAGQFAKMALSGKQ